MAYVYLFAAIIAEVLGTSALKASQEFTRFWPSVFAVVGYSVAFYLLALVFRSLPVGIAYALWAGLGIMLITLVGAVVFKEKLDLPAILGVAMIIGGVVIIQVFSRVTSH